MNALETRGTERQRVLMLAYVTVENSSEKHRVRIRDLSAKGLRAEGNVAVRRQTQLEVHFGSEGRVRGVVAWCEGNVFGVALETEIQPDVVRRATIQVGEESHEVPRFVRELGSVKHDLGPPRVV